MFSMGNMPLGIWVLPQAVPIQLLQKRIGLDFPIDYSP